MVICKNLCQNYPNATPFTSGKINYDFEKFCGVCSYKTWKKIGGSKCPCCGRPFRTSSRQNGVKHNER